MAFTKKQAANGVDSYIGTSGVDVITLEESANIFLGAQKDDDSVNIQGSDGNASRYTLNGGAGNDTFNERSSVRLTNSLLRSDDGNDTLTLAGLTSSTASGGVGRDTISTSSEMRSSLVNGNQNNDTININAGASSSSIFGGIGQDAINLSTSIVSSTARANEGDDTITIAAGTTLNGSTVNGNQGNDLITINQIASFIGSTIFGGIDNDTVNAAASTVGIVMNGDDGADNLTGGSATDTLTGGLGNDNLSGNAGNDRFIVDSGSDAITDFGNGGGDEVITSATTTTTATVTAANAVTAASVNNGTLNANTAAGIAADSTVSFAQLGVNGVTLSAAATNNRLLLTGSNQADTITGGGGTDTITSTAGNDQLTGGAANDRYNIAGGTVAITDFGLGGGELVDIGAGAIVNATINVANTIAGTSDNAGTFNVTTTATIAADSDVVFTNLGTNGVTFTGAATTNRLRPVGSAQADTITGGGGIDTITGAGGSDSMTGGAAVDTFVQLTGQSTAATTENIQNGNNVRAGGVMTFGNGVDVINGFVAGAGVTADHVDVAGANNLVTRAAGDAVNGLTLTNNILIRGAFAGNAFTQADAGADALVCFDVENATLTNGANAANFLVITGVGGTLVAGDFV